MAKFDPHKYRMKCLERQGELLKQSTMTDADKLEYLMLDIQPYSLNWRNGVVSALKHAIKLLNREEHNALCNRIPTDDCDSVDPYCFVASIVFGIEYDKINSYGPFKDHRQAIKDYMEDIVCNGYSNNVYKASIEHYFPWLTDYIIEHRSDEDVGLVIKLSYIIHHRWYKGII